MNWKPIDTAPTSTDVLVADSTEIAVAVLEYQEGSSGAAVWFYSRSPWDQKIDFRPTHWAALPELPRQA